ncbi:MAG: FliM/FliN family flagellar motor switch protein [Campylobacterales bacterium]|nr:FliM/FliN family flagellar motor switch protein [Campylobacterales bacterium]
MRADTQADSLEVMMHKHQIYPHYTLALAPFEVKKRALKELQRGDILLLGLDRLRLVLLDAEGVTAEVMIEHRSALDRLKIVSLGVQAQERISKKYQAVSVMLGEIPCKKLEVGHVIGTMDLDFDHLTIAVEGKKIAEGSLVNVGGRIALQINEMVSS